mgnify:CR=1 FL=1
MDREQIEFIIRNALDEEFKNRPLTDAFVKQISDALTRQGPFAEALAKNISHFVSDMIEEQIDKCECGEANTTELIRISQDLDLLKKRADDAILKHQKYDDVIATIVQHQKHHSDNEHKWGIVSWVRKWPVKTILLIIALFIALCYGVNFAEFVTRYFRMPAIPQTNSVKK